MAPPSNLPSFPGLASQIAGGGSIEAGPLDRFLGKLAREKQTDVHAAAARLVYGNHTCPTLLHHEVLRLFGTVSKVRLVTTNFDDHFSAAARKLFKKERLREFCAPALPLGDNFTGLVYLHGSARIDPGKLVVTDRDFGAAYMTRGWARDFLVSLFSNYTVLFIGYSHNDVTTSYLARGLDSSQLGQRWAMVPSNEDVNARENWNHLEIATIEYAIDPDNVENTHHHLTDFFSKWADHTKDSVFAKAKRVKVIARGLPKESEDDSAYLRYCLSDARLADEFCRAIRHPAWVGWMHDHGYFDCLFGDTATNARVIVGHRVLAHWLCSVVRRRYPDLLLDLIRTHHQYLSRELSQTLAHLLWVDQRKKPDRHFATWLSVLLSQGKHAVDEGIWGYLLQECRIPNHCGVAFGLFELLTTPELRVERGWNWSLSTLDADAPKRRSHGRVDFAIGWPREAIYGLSKAWMEVFEPHLPQVGDALATIIVQQFTYAYLLLRGVGKLSKHYDLLSRSRSSIAPHEQDDIHRNDCLALLIDILRSILDQWIETTPPRARQQVDAWWSTELPLLMRFAAYARSRDPQYGADDRIEWVLANDLVFRSGMKKEIFDVLASSYPDASPSVRHRLIHRIDRGDRGPGVAKLDQATLAYEKFNVLVWLRRSDPACSLVESAISEILDAHPNFGEREHPEFDSWHGKAGFIDPTDGVDFDRIISQPPEQFVVELLHADKSSVHRDLRSYLQCLPRLFKQNKEWGRRFVEALAQETEADDETWNGVFWGWRDTLETPADWEWIVDVISRLPHNRAIFDGVANLIAHGFGISQGNWHEKLIGQAASLMDRAWELCKSEKATQDQSYGDWLTTAINHVGGWIGEFWVHYCSHLRQCAGEDWQGIPESLRSKIIEALRGTNRAKVNARIALTPWIGHFFAWDRNFAIDHLLPLLDWELNPIVAQQSWSVFLSYNRGTRRELEELLGSFYKQCAERADQLDDEALRHFGPRLAAMAIHVIPDPVESGFFRDFLPLLPDVVRGSLALSMGNQLKELNDDERKMLWDKWLKRYLDLRLIGVPVALSTVETKYMLEWCIYLGSAFDEAVERIARMPQKSVEAYGILQELAKSPAVDQSPLAACRLAIAAMQSEGYPHLGDSLLTLHHKFKNTIRREPEFSTFEELLYRRGWKK